MNHKKLCGILCILGATIAYALVPSFSFLAFGVGVETETVLFNKFFWFNVNSWGRKRKKSGKNQSRKVSVDFNGCESREFFF